MKLIIKPLLASIIWGASFGLAQASILYSYAGPQLISDNNAFPLPGLSLSRGTSATGKLYFKYTVTNPASNKDTENYYAAMSFFEGGSEHLGVGNGWEQFAYSAFGPNGVANLNSATPETVETYQLVRSTDITTILIRVDFNSGSNDLITVWLNPNLTLPEAAQNPALTTTFHANADFDTIYLREGGNNGDGWTFSDIAIAENATDAGFFAAPESTTTFTWDGGGSDNQWSTAANWFGGNVADGFGSIAIFTQATGADITLDSARTIGGLNFANANYSITGTSTLTLDVITGVPTLDAAAGITATLGIQLAGADGLRKTGSGTLTLAGAIGYTGNTFVHGGNLQLSSDSGIGNLQIDGADASVRITAGTTTVTSTNGDSHVTGGGLLEIAGGSLIIQGGSSWFSVGDHPSIPDGNGTLTLIDGTFTNTNSWGITVGEGNAGAGTININGGFFTADDTVNNAGILLGGAAGGNGTLNLNGGILTTDRILCGAGVGTIHFNGGQLESTGDNTDILPNNGNLAVMIMSGGLLVGGTKDFTISEGLEGAGILVKNDINSVLLTGQNTYSGGTIVNGGTLVLDAAGTIGSGNLTVHDGTTCEIRNTAGAVADTATVQLSGTGKLILASGVTESVSSLYVNGMKQAPGLYDAGSLGANLTGGGTLNVLGGTFVLTAPVTRQVVQRNGSGTGSIMIAGAYTDNPDRIEARAVVMAGSENNGTSTPWATMVTTPSGGTFSGTLADVPAGGWYQIEVRAVTDSGPSVYTAVVQRVGVGDVYLTAGQSNSANYGTPGTNTADRVSAMNYANGVWTMAADPMPGADGTLGSVWTRLGMLLTSTDSVPVGFVCVGVGGTTVSYWVPPSTDGYLRLKAAAQAFPANGFRAVLWHQGESDSYISTSAADYEARLASTISQLRADAGWAMPWYVAEVGFMPNTTLAQRERVVAGQRRVIYADPLVFAGPSTDDFHLEGKLVDHVHFNDAGLVDHAQQWAQLLAGTAPLAPKNGDIESNTSLPDGGIVSVNMEDVSSSSVIGWRILNSSGEAVPDGSNGYFNPDTVFYGPSAADTNASGGILPNMSGRHVAFFYGGSAGNQFLQTRRATLQPNTTYALTVALGVRGNSHIYGNARIELLADGAAIASHDVTLADLNTLNGGNAVNTFTDVQLTYSTGATVTAGQPLAIRITKINGLSGSDPTYLDFDKVRLTSSDNGPGPSDYDTWKSSFGLTGGPDGDDDHDGLSNRFEYAFGQDPVVPSGHPVTFLSTSSGPHLTYTRRKQSLTGLGFKVWTSPDLTVWTEDTTASQSSTAIPASDNESVEVTLSPALLNADRLFIRISAE